jgi:N-glycosylase/DNA lyase
MPILKANDFSLAHTLECGQVFRAAKVGDWYYVNARDRLFKIRQKGDDLTYGGDADDAFLRRYFSLDHDLNEILAKIGLDEHVSKAIEQYRGLRILRQDPWECLISFLCSRAQNIPNIRKTVESICETFGKKVRLDDYVSYTFPAPGQLKDMEGLKAAKTGFRAESIAASNSLHTEESLTALAKPAYPDAKKKLMELPGVADKVADCVLLFSLGFLQAFPVDTWIKQAMCECYFGGQKVSPDKIREFAQIYFGEYAGYAQQYLFYQIRLAKGGEPEPEEEENGE